MGHHGCRGATVAAMVQCVLSIDMCVVRNLYCKIHLPATIRLFIARKQKIPPVCDRTGLRPCLEAKKIEYSNRVAYVLKCTVRCPVVFYLSDLVGLAGQPN